MQSELLDFCFRGSEKFPSFDLREIRDVVSMLRAATNSSQWAAVRLLPTRRCHALKISILRSSSVIKILPTFLFF